ncbi:hypothetical protein FJZ33_08550 [Candidatus Poribacteria bacterium]|nr:hypothetical protein [Candidatus Poribacteria bacterium]
MEGHIRMIAQNRLSDLIRSEVGSANPRKVLIAGSLMTGAIIAGITVGPKSATADIQCPQGWDQCGPDWLNLCCQTDMGWKCCWGSWCTAPSGIC